MEHPNIRKALDLLESVEARLRDHDEDKHLASKVQEAIDILMPMRSDKVQEL